MSGDDKMIVIGLTGGSGSGKSTIAALMKQKGIDVIDADKIARDIVRKGERALCEITKEFGEDVLLENGELDRKKLASIVFTNRDELKKLNRITHKYITEAIKQRLSQNLSDISLIDAPVLKESGIIDICDYVIAVIADKDVRVKRIIERDGITHQGALDRINSQELDEQYAECADFVINNSGDESIQYLVDDIMKKIGGVIRGEK